MKAGGRKRRVIKEKSAISESDDNLINSDQVYAGDISKSTHGRDYKWKKKLENGKISMKRTIGAENIMNVQSVQTMDVL